MNLIFARPCPGRSFKEFGNFFTIFIEKKIVKN
jgi:hypothetical protein